MACFQWIITQAGDVVLDSFAGSSTTGYAVMKLSRDSEGVMALSPLIGACRGKACYLLFNGVLRDRCPDGGNVLTWEVLAELPAHDGPRVDFGEACRMRAARLKREGVTFRQIPYQIMVS